MDLDPLSAVHYQAFGTPVPQTTDPFDMEASFTAVEVDPVPLWVALLVVHLTADPQATPLPSATDPSVSMFHPKSGLPDSRPALLPLPDPTMMAATLALETLPPMVQPVPHQVAHPTAILRHLENRVELVH